MALSTFFPQQYLIIPAYLDIFFRNISLLAHINTAINTALCKDLIDLLNDLVLLINLANLPLKLLFFASTKQVSDLDIICKSINLFLLL